MAPFSPNLLIIDDDSRLRGLISQYLRDNGFIVASAENAQKGRELMQSLSFDLIVLDVQMPGESGLQFLEFLRKSSQIPVLMLTAQGESASRIDGLEAGADDYMAKPFEPKELVLRIKSILKRGQNNKLEVSGLTTAEETLLKILSQNMGHTIGRDDIAAKLGINSRAVDVQVTRLRKKLEDADVKNIYIQTVRGSGYRLNNS